MVSPLPPKDYDVTLKFGGGLHTRASEDEIDPREAADGKNFLLDLENRELRRRPPFDLIGTVPNAAEIRGGASLLKADGTVSFLIQAGTKVYEWNGLTTFTEKATVNVNAKLRGHFRTHNFTLDSKVLITDLSLLETVKEWDGTTWASVAFLSNPSNSFGSFSAKYVTVQDERAIYAHTKDAGGTFPHMIVGSLRSDYATISVDDRPSSALSEEDPFFLLTPDLRPINGLVAAFGTTIISSEKGQIFNLSGASAKDFAFDPFFPGSAASGQESVEYIGNDILYGRQGRIESVRDTERFGNAENDDLTVGIADQIEDIEGWRLVFNSRLNRVYCFPDEGSEVWVFNTAMRNANPVAKLRGGQGDAASQISSALSGGSRLSPWMRWTTEHEFAFQPTFVMSMLDPLDGLEYVFMGDGDGNLFRLEGSGAEGDAGDTNIDMSWLSKLFSAPLDAQAYEVQGYIKYRKDVAATVRLTFQYAGEAIFNHSVEITMPAVAGRNYYAGGAYYSDGFYYGSISGRLSRRGFHVPGQANDFQVLVEIGGVNESGINEIGIRFKAAS